MSNDKGMINNEDELEQEYDFSKGIRNPYAARPKGQKRQITINIDGATIDYFKKKAAETGLPYQTLINLYLTDCARNDRQLEITWE